MTSYDTYQTSLTLRYCSREMSQLFSQRRRISTWRQLWLFLAEAEKELGALVVTDKALDQMRAHIEVSDEDFDVARVEEKRRLHDVMAHVHAFGQVAPAAAGIIHYGATSCYVTDNAELMLMKEAIGMLLPKLAKVLKNLCSFATTWKAEPTLAYTHLQAAQPITVGRRAAQWAQDLFFDLETIEEVGKKLRFRGAQGTTGTKASFLEIFHGDATKVARLNELLCHKAGFESCYDVSAQTYSRKIDVIIANAIAGLGASAHKIMGDVRHLSHWKEVEEPFYHEQVGSSAMSYKRNPMKSERVCSLSRQLMSKPASFQNTFSTQWMERTLDDSAIRRIDIPEMFLLADAILIGLDDVTSGLVVYPNRIAARIQEELPFLITESVIMKLVAKGVSRQEAHEQLRVLCLQAAEMVKDKGKKNDLVERIKATPFFAPVWSELDDMLKAELYIGLSVEDVERFCGKDGVLDKKLESYKFDMNNVVVRSELCSIRSE